MNYDDFITIGGQILAKTGSGELKLVPWPREMHINMFDDFEPDRLPGTGYQYKKLIEEGGDLVNIKNLSDADTKKLYQDIRTKFGTNQMHFNLHREKGQKVANTWGKIASKIKGMAPAIAGFSTIPGAIASGLLYTGTAKPVGAGSAPLDYINTPFEPRYTSTNISPQISESFDREPVVFDKYVQNKIQNLQNNQGIMGARADRNFTKTDYGKAYNTGGIVSLMI